MIVLFKRMPLTVSSKMIVKSHKGKTFSAELDHAYIHIALHSISIDVIINARCACARELL